MLRRQRKERRPGDYLSEERYGLWVGSDYVAVERFNAWVSERSEYTRMHAFVNSQDLDLTSNRGSVENTPAELLKDIENTVKLLFEKRIEPDEDYIKFQDELLAIERHRHASREADDYRRRLRRLAAKEVTKVSGVEFYSPQTETDLIALAAGLQSVLPDLFPFVVRDYDFAFRVRWIGGAQQDPCHQRDLAFVRRVQGRTQERFQPHVRASRSDNLLGFPG